MSRHVLVVDDEADIRSTIEFILEVEGYQVSTASNGQEALDRIKQEQPAVVLLDIQMPVLDGRDVVGQLRHDGIDVPVVVMTAAAKSSSVAEELQTEGHLGKPFDLDELLTVVSRFTAHP